MIRVSRSASTSTFSLLWSLLLLGSILFLLNLKFSALERETNKLKSDIDLVKQKVFADTQSSLYSKVDQIVDSKLFGFEHNQLSNILASQREQGIQEMKEYTDRAIKAQKPIALVQTLPQTTMPTVPPVSVQSRPHYSLPTLLDHFSNQEVLVTTESEKNKLAILVAFRDGCGKTDQGSGRTANLEEFRTSMQKHLHSVNPSLEYVIIVAEQTQAGLFNKGVLFNAAFIVAVRKFNANYVVFHDVDQIPTSLLNTYALEKPTPKHLCVNSDQFQAYSAMVGGALMMTSQEVVEVNGFSNLFDGWGLEDDDMYNRISSQLGRQPSRLSHQVGSYHALPHPRVRDLDVSENFRRKQRLYQAKNFQQDGLNSLQVRARIVPDAQSVEETETYFRFQVKVLSESGQEPEAC